MILRVKDWTEFQHYKKRKPPWIKLYRDLLDNYDWHRLPEASRALAPMLWLLASEDDEGVIAKSAEEIAFRLHTTGHAVEAALKPLIDAGFFFLEQDASTTLATRPQSACSERESDSEKESETEAKPSEAKASDAGASLSGIVFGQGLDWLRRTSKRSDTQCRSFLGKVRSDVGDEALIVMLESARRESVIEPFGYLAKAVATHKAAHDPPKRALKWN